MRYIHSFQANPEMESTRIWILPNVWKEEHSCKCVGTLLYAWHCIACQESRKYAVENKMTGKWWETKCSIPCGHQSSLSLPQETQSQCSRLRSSSHSFGPEVHLLLYRVVACHELNCVRADCQWPAERGSRKFRSGQQLPRPRPRLGMGPNFDWRPARAVEAVERST